MTDVRKPSCKPLKALPHGPNLEALIRSAHENLLIIQDLDDECLYPAGGSEFGELLDACNNILVPQLVELSFIDPDDQTQDRVLAPLLVPAAQDAHQLANVYREQMRANLRAAGAAGPIVPHPDLYKVAAWIVTLPPSSGLCPCPAARPSDWTLFLLSYNLTPRHDQPARPCHETQIRANILDFAHRMVNSVPWMQERIDTLLVLPFPRPLGTAWAGDDLPGGALFVWGASTEHRIRREQIWPLRDLVLRTIVRFAAGRAEASATLDLQGMCAHHLQNFLTVRGGDEYQRDLERLTERLAEVALMLPEGAPSCKHIQVIREDLGTVARRLGDDLPAIAEFRKVFGLMAQRAGDDPARRMRSTLEGRSCNLRNLFDDAVAIAQSMHVTTIPEPSVIPDYARLPGSALLYRILARELIKNAQANGAQKMEVRLLGPNWSDTQADFSADCFWIEFRDDGSALGRSAGAPNIPSELGRGLGLPLLKRFVADFLFSTLEGPQRKAGGPGACVRIRLLSWEGLRSAS